MVECEFILFIDIMYRLRVLIDTWWNVNQEPPITDYR